ncbi:DUF4186 domain-containing protein [PVC group bacterium]|nr:DUF4186 domain-containing protein [PVC group bacterium]
MSKKIDDVLKRLTQSSFRSQFKLDEKDLEYISVRGFDTIKKHAYDFIARRIAPPVIKNDGKQTPMSGHPVFKAQHATATCCRKCLEKWHKIKINRQLNQKEIQYTGDVILEWLEKQCVKNQPKRKKDKKEKIGTEKS